MNRMERQRVEKFPGVYYREHPERKHNGKPDRCFDISYKTADGKKIWEKIGWSHEGYTAAMASQVRAERVRALRHGEELPQKKKEQAITFGECWKEYAKWAETNRKSFKAETNRYEKHIKPVLETTAMSEITSFMLEGIKHNLHKKELSPQTVKHVLVLIRQVINKAVALGLWDGKNPIKEVKIPRPNNARQRFLSRDEAERLLNELAIVSPQWRDIALLSLHTGMRAGEIFALRWEHLDIENGVIQITDPKGGPAQTAYMTETIKELFRCKMEADGGVPGGWVFKSRDGEQIKEVSDTFERTVKRLGFNNSIEDRRQKVCFHTCRHTFASWLALEGTPILTIKELLRHSSLAMTERYAHLIPDHKKQAINVIEAKMNRPSESSGEALV